MTCETEDPESGWPGCGLDLRFGERGPLGNVFIAKFRGQTFSMGSTFKLIFCHKDGIWIAT
eukprot:9375164-Karenia_brevis.AAC.1